MTPNTTTPTPAANPGQASNAKTHTHFTTEAAPLRVVFTRYDSPKPLSKAFDLVDGKIDKALAAQMGAGKAHRIECGFADFGMLLDGLTAKQACGYGQHDTAQFGNPARLVVADWKRESGCARSRSRNTARKSAQECKAVPAFPPMKSSTALRPNIKR